MKLDQQLADVGGGEAEISTSGTCLHGTQDEVGTTKHNTSARCQ